MFFAELAGHPEGWNGGGLNEGGSWAVPSSYSLAEIFCTVPRYSTLTMYSTVYQYILVGGKTQKIRPEYRALHTTEALQRVLTWLGIGD